MKPRNAIDELLNTIKEILKDGDLQDFVKLKLITEKIRNYEVYDR